MNSTTKNNNLSRIVFPDRTSFADFFIETVQFDLLKSSSKRKPGVVVTTVPVTGWQGDTFNIEIGPFLSVKAYDGETYYFDIRPRPELVEWLKTNTALERGPVSFEAIQWKDGSILLIARLSQLIADQWLALLPASALSQISKGSK